MPIPIVAPIICGAILFKALNSKPKKIKTINKKAEFTITNSWILTQFRQKWIEGYRDELSIGLEILRPYFPTEIARFPRYIDFDGDNYKYINCVDNWSIKNPLVSSVLCDIITYIKTRCL